MTSRRATTTLWRPVGPEELELLRDLKWRAWPPRLPEQPIFYPVLNEDYAVRIARDWNVKHDGAGFVTRFEVESEFLRRYPVQRAGGRTILELWVPAGELGEFTTHIVGEIEVVHEFRSQHQVPGRTVNRMTGAYRGEAKTRRPRRLRHRRNLPCTTRLHHHRYQRTTRCRPCPAHRTTL